MVFSVYCLVSLFLVENTLCFYERLVPFSFERLAPFSFERLAPPDFVIAYPKKYKSSIFSRQ